MCVYAGRGAGTVTDFIQQERPERPEPDRESTDFWRAYRTLPVEAFFEEWKDNFRNLEWVMVPGNVDDGVLCRHDRMTDVSSISIPDAPGVFSEYHDTPFESYISSPNSDTVT